MNTPVFKQNGSNLINAEEIYHSFNRTNNHEILFKSEMDHQAFLDVIKTKLENYVDFIAHNLIPNHFHFMYKVKPVPHITKYLDQLALSEMCLTHHKFLKSEKTSHDIDLLICNQFRCAFISYAEGVNKSYKRKGNLFSQNFKSVVVPDEHSQKITLRYINCNTIKHTMDILPDDHEWSSYNDYFDDGKEIVNMDLAMKYFEDIKSVEAFHQEYVELHASYLLKKKEVSDLEQRLFPEHLQ